jgi:hypothetical protein
MLDIAAATLGDLMTTSARLHAAPDHYGATCSAVGRDFRGAPGNRRGDGDG